MSGNVDQPNLGHQNADQRFAPPEAHVADLEASGSGELAGRGIRLAAAIVDGLIIMALIWVLMRIPTVAALLEQPPGWFSFNFASLLVGGGLFLLVQGWLVVNRGQTLGKMAFKLRIVRTDGSKVDAARMLGLRYGIGYLIGTNVALSVIYGLLDPLLIFRKSRQCLHDTIADTKVIKL